MDTLLQYPIKVHFIWGLAVGLLIASFAWKEQRRLIKENADLKRFPAIHQEIHATILVNFK